MPDPMTMHDLYAARNRKREEVLERLRALVKSYKEEQSMWVDSDGGDADTLADFVREEAVEMF